MGNGMMALGRVGGHCRKLAPYAYSIHFKDHIVTCHNNEKVVCSVPIDEGGIDIDSCFKMLVEKPGVTRINIETCFPYTSLCSRPCSVPEAIIKTRLQ